MKFRSLVPYVGLLVLMIVGINPGLEARGEVYKIRGGENCCLTSFGPDLPNDLGSSTGLLPNVTYARMEPFAIRIGLETATLTIGVDDPAVVAVRIIAGHLSLDGNWSDFITLVDDGTQGDETAGDGLFTRDQLTIAVPYESSPGNYRRSHRILTRTDLTFIFGDGHEETGTVDLGHVILIGVDPSMAIPSVVRSGLAGNMHHTDYVVNIVQELDSAFPDYRFSFEDAAKQYYAVLPDDRDFLIFSIMFNWKDLGGRFGVVRNDLEGIGLDLYDESSLWGSSGVLHGVMTTGYPSAEVLNHEFLHRWGVYLNDTLNLTSHGHWNAAARPGSGFGLGSNHINTGIYRELAHETANVYHAGHVDYSGAYNDLELYLMGLIPISDVENPILSLTNPIFKETIYPSGASPPTARYDVFEADGLGVIQTQDIVSTEGPRVPDYLNSQRVFKSALIVVYDRPLTDVEFAALDFQMREYEKPASDFGPLSNFPDLTFQAATGGRASMQMRLNTTPTGIDSEHTSTDVVQAYTLHQNYPNPFNPVTTISYRLATSERIRVEIFNLLGERISILEDGYKSPGNHEVVFDAGHLSSGVYFYSLFGESFAQTRKMIVLK